MSLENGLVIGSGNFEGDQIRFVCDETYTLVGEEFLKCTNRGIWNASEPICSGKRAIIKNFLYYILIYIYKSFVVPNTSIDTEKGYLLID